MRRLGAFSTILGMLSVAAAAPVLAQALPGTASDPASLGLRSTAAPAAASPGGNVSATGRKMPPTTGRLPASAATDPKGTRGRDASKTSDAGLKSSTEVEMLKAQKASEERNKAWDGKMRKTMGSICNGC